MLAIVAPGTHNDREIWGDIDEIFGVRGKGSGTSKEAAEKKAEIAKQIGAGESEIKAQKVESWLTDPG
jgi:hypothetical protein